MPLKTGALVGPYEIISLLGAGGMGEVYRARDPRLSREAAIKVLPEQFTNDSDRLRRFEQEARAAGMLNHPNILTIHDIGTTDGTVYVVSELLEGETLRQRLQSGSIPPRKAVEYALQMAHGLSAAHDKGIAHRDLKPENIYITRDGRVKILDFGLAKLSTPEAVSEHSKLQTMDPGTQPGMIMGTVGYMAPEQVRGLGADHRSDIFAFGAILYEMLTGTRAFHGNSAADTMSAILKEDPSDVSSANKNIPPALERVIRHCLEKNPEERFQSARDLAFDLEMISGISTTTAQQQPVVAESRKMIPWKLLVALLVIVGFAIAFWSGRKSAGGMTKAASIAAPMQASFRRLTDLPGEEEFPSISPDGKSFVYVHAVKDQLHIFLSRVGGQKPIDLTDDSDVNNTAPAFSPDGQQIAFRSERDGGGIFLMGATGESIKRLSNFGFNPSWSPDGKDIVCGTEGVSAPLGRGSTSELWTVRVPSGEKRLITKGDAVEPSWSPHGSRIAFWGLRGEGGQRDIWTIDPKGEAEPVSVTDDHATDWNPFWSPDGKYLYFVSDRGGTMNLWRVAIEESSGKVFGQPQSVTTPSVWSRHFSISANGQIIFSALDRRSIFQTIQFDSEKQKLSGEMKTIFISADLLFGVELSPDGKWLTYATWWPQPDIYVARTDGSENRKLTDDPEKDRYPAWSPDGKDIIFMSDRSGRYDFWMIHPDGSGLRKATETAGSALWAPYFSPDGRYLSAINEKGTFLFDTSKPTPWKNPVALAPFPETAWALGATLWSADSKKLFGEVGPAGGATQKEIAVYSLDTRTYEQFSLPYTPLDFDRVSPTRLIILTDNNHLLTLDIPSKKVSEVSISSASPIGNIRYNAAQKILLLRTDSAESDIWLMSLNSQ
jgi:eukaryotic-like serine/threonine-protein kinase